MANNSSLDELSSPSRFRLPRPVDGSCYLWNVEPSPTLYHDEDYAFVLHTTFDAAGHINPDAMYRLLAAVYRTNNAAFNFAEEICMRSLQAYIATP